MTDKLINQILLICSNDGGQPITEEWRQSTRRLFNDLPERDKQFLLGLSPEALEEVLCSPVCYGETQTSTLSPEVASFLDEVMGC